MEVPATGASWTVSPSGHLSRPGDFHTSAGMVGGEGLETLPAERQTFGAWGEN